MNLNIYDISGKIIKQLISNENQEAGTHNVRLEATSEMQNGVYICQLKVGDRQETIKLLLQR